MNNYAHLKPEDEMRVRAIEFAKATFEDISHLAKALSQDLKTYETMSPERQKAYLFDLGAGLHDIRAYALEQAQALRHYQANPPPSWTALGDQGPYTAQEWEAK